MHLKLIAAAVITGVFVLAPVPAAAACCDQSIDILSLLPLQDDPMLTGDAQLNPAPPARQLTEVWFHRPVMVGRHILQGRYVIEHDNDRMARGEPCTHIYAYNNQRVPVVAFHCTHLDRDRADANIAVLATAGDGGMQRLLEFQFAGETASHGVPAGR